jgi:hypothetical protein
LRRIDVVHRGFHFGIGDDIGHEHVDDFVAEARHIGVELLLHGRGNSRLAREYFIERHSGNMPEDHLFDVRLNLRRRIRQLVESVKGFFRPNPVLHRDRYGDEDIVFGLGLHRQCYLIDPQAHPRSHGVNERPLPVQARIGHAQEPAKSGDDGDLCSLDREKTAQDKEQHQDAQKSKDAPAKGFHCDPL